MFHMIGTLCGLAIYNFTIIDLHFPLALFKKLLKKQVMLDDLMELMPDVGSKLCSTRSSLLFVIALISAMMLFADDSSLILFLGLQLQARIHLWDIWIIWDTSMSLVSTNKERDGLSKRSRKFTQLQNRRKHEIGLCYVFTEGKGNLSKAKKYHNVIRSAMLPFSTTHTAVPYLHILLGVVKKHHELLEQQCDEIDKQIAADMAHLVDFQMGFWNGSSRGAGSRADAFLHKEAREPSPRHKTSRIGSKS
ncbi:hypothetical protein RRG08_030533 [Elysia crispata]|uniref:HECT domain-containing protein n=1 Tax=Elysia crispata TaxID=231223 RepID=A0AAE0YHN1_9GAST|nr:hypothetical protein RRG08_030533 [Elysia crispata]